MVDGALPLEQALAQGDSVAELLARVRQVRSRRAARGLTRVPHFLQQSFTFRQGENVSQPFVFASPVASAFEAHRLAVYASMRIVSLSSADGESEVSFRPTPWTHSVMVTLTTGPLSQIWANAIDRLIDAQVELAIQSGEADSYEMQSTPFPVAQCFSGGVNGDTVGGTLVSAKPSLLVFQHPVILRPGRTLLAKVSPTFSGVRTLDSRVNEYMITAVLEGARLLQDGGQ